MDKNKNLALYGIIGAVLYAVADWFLYVGLEIDSGNMLSYCHVAEWRLMASMWISLFGSLGLLLGFISLYQLVKVSFGEKSKFIMILPFLAAGGILYCHFVLGVYNPLTYQGAIKAGLSESQILKILENTSEGLSDYLMDRVPLDAIITETTTENLSYIPCGELIDDPVRLLCSSKMNDARLELEGTFDFIIYDMPAVNAAMDAKVMSVSVDATILVSAINDTSKKGLYAAANILTEANANLIGTIINKMDMEQYVAYREDYDYFRNERYVRKNKNKAK